MQNSNYTLGLVSVSFRKYLVKDIIKAVKEAGLSCIEWGSDVHAPCLDKERLLEISKLQNEYGIKCCSYGTYFRLGETPIEQLEDYISAAKILGTDILRLWCGTKSGADMSDVEKEELFKECKKASEIAKKLGVTLCMECHKNTFTEYPSDAKLLVNAVNSSSFLTYWQPSQWQNYENNVESAKIYAPFTKHIHVFNWEGTKKFSLELAIDKWRGYLNNFSVPRTLLLEFMPNGTLEELITEVTYNI